MNMEALREIAKLLGWKYMGLAATVDMSPHMWMPPEGGKLVSEDDLADRLGLSPHPPGAWVDLDDVLRQLRMRTRGRKLTNKELDDMARGVWPDCATDQTA